MNSQALAAIGNALLAFVVTGGLYQFLTIRQKRRQIVGDATSAEANAATTLTGGALDLVEGIQKAHNQTRADLKEARDDVATANERIDHLEDQVDSLRQRERDLEDALHRAGVRVPPRRRSYDRTGPHDPPESRLDPSGS